MISFNQLYEVVNVSKTFTRMDQISLFKIEEDSREKLILILGINFSNKDPLQSAFHFAEAYYLGKYNSKFPLDILVSNLKSNFYKVVINK